MKADPTGDELDRARRAFVQELSEQRWVDLLAAEDAWLADQGRRRAEERAAVAVLVADTAQTVAERCEAMLAVRETLRSAERALETALAARVAANREAAAGAVDVFIPAGPTYVVKALGPTIAGTLAAAVAEAEAAEFRRVAASADHQAAAKRFGDAMTKHRRAVARLGEIGGLPEPREADQGEGSGVTGVDRLPAINAFDEDDDAFEDRWATLDAIAERSLPAWRSRANLDDQAAEMPA